MEYDNAGDLKGLLQVMKRLRGPEGCPWDREQTKETLKWYLVEECYEVLDAIESGSAGQLKEELGDTLFQLVFLAEISEEKKDFNIFDVINFAREKMIRRHPHVFGSESAKDSKDVKKIWWEVKEKEKEREGSSVLETIPDSLPGLLRAFRITKRAAHAGFDRGSLKGTLAAIEKGIVKLRATVKEKDPDKMEEELGDILFSLVNLGRFLEINPEEALRKAIMKFIYQFKETEKSLKQQNTT